MDSRQGRGWSVGVASGLAESGPGPRDAVCDWPPPRTKAPAPSGVFKAFTVTVDPSGTLGLGIDVDAIRGVADSGRFADDLSDLFEVLGETARDLRIGVLILVDELQEATAAELTAVNTAMHHLGQAATPLPLTFVGAGLPSLPAQLGEATSYAERLYDHRSIGLLDESASEAALIVPARLQGVEWQPEGLAAAVGTAGGYPYFLQSIGKSGTMPAGPRSTAGMSRLVSATPGGRSMTVSTARAGSEPPPRSAISCERWRRSAEKPLPQLRRSVERWDGRGPLTSPSRGTN